MRSASFYGIIVALNIAVLPSARAVVPNSPLRDSSRTTKPKPNKRMVVLDISSAGDQRKVVNRIFSLPADDADPAVQKLRTQLLAMVKSSPDAGDVSSAASEVIKSLDSLSDSLALRSSSRWISTKGDKVEIYLLRSAGRPGQIDVKEEPRSTRLSSDFVTLMELAQKIATLGFNGGRPPAPKYSFTYREFVLTKPRATLKLVGTLVPDKTKADPAAPPDSLKVSLITGPKEHFFLSANVANSQAHQFRYDETTKSIQPVAKPKQFFVGIDYTVGDILDDSKQSRLRSLRDGLYLGFTLEGSSRPFDQFGFSLGSRYNPLGFVTLETVSPYVGLLWTRSDRNSGSTAAPVIDHRYGKGKVVFGLSLNLDKALGWVGK